MPEQLRPEPKDLGEAATSIPHFPYGLTTKKDVMTLSHRDVFFRKH